MTEAIIISLLVYIIIVATLVAKNLGIGGTSPGELLKIALSLDTKKGIFAFKFSGLVFLLVVFSLRPNPWLLEALILIGAIQCLYVSCIIFFDAWFEKVMPTAHYKKIWPR